eukprot:CAMPEP_0170407150 /NCGR_PEP_ID=MMETSP0117_2-20130122/28094_1 /TAXON_ID=400756 /ORGANISM="Durinskia baltica, Strain CSIRO CS-38" /LENGTH=120 /DNA_ID=CAMNT_0010664379 /DNA_START=12 /DNA_END=371 /DNA_ORIENTATION=+
MCRRAGAEVQKSQQREARAGSRWRCEATALRGVRIAGPEKPLPRAPARVVGTPARSQLERRPTHDTRMFVMGDVRAGLPLSPAARRRPNYMDPRALRAGGPLHNRGPACLAGSTTAATVL